MNVYKCWYRVIVCLLSRQIIIRQTQRVTYHFHGVETSFKEPVIFLF